MASEITLVTLIDGDELSINETKAFTLPQQANEYFIKLLKEYFPEETKDWTDEDFESCLDDGYYQDLTHYCLTINEIPLH